jgi:target of rapamycin complex subunit LST8
VVYVCPLQGLAVTKDFQAHDDYLLKCVISPDLRSIATTSADKTIKLWDTSNWELETILNKHQRWVWDCVYSADSLYLLTASSDQSAKLWDLRSGDVIRNYTGHSLAVTCVALNDSSFQ